MGTRTMCIGIASLLATAPAGADSEMENFEGGRFSNPVFQHDLEFTTCCFEILDPPFALMSWALNLRPNTDVITFDLPAGAAVREVRVDVYDFEGGFAGRPSSAVIARGASGDFVFANAAELEVWEIITLDESMPGQLTGDPIGPIASLELQAPNEVLGPFGGLFVDNITIEFDLGCDADCDGSGALDFFDFLCFQNLFGLGDPAADCDGSGGLDLFDFLCFQNEFAAGCR
ncbi:MAG: hypothetical protein ACF8R7_02630 [Phycisphaerales bacterium JB039]